LKRIKGQMIFVAEDEPLVSLDIADALRAAGANVVSAHNVRDALTIAATADLSAAVLDVNLAGEGCSLICQQLAARGIPFLFHTGYTDVPFLDEWPAAPVLRKPSSPAEIIGVLGSLLADPHVVVR